MEKHGDSTHALKGKIHSEIEFTYCIGLVQLSLLCRASESGHIQCSCLNRFVEHIFFTKTATKFVRGYCLVAFICGFICQDVAMEQCSGSSRVNRRSSHAVLV